MEYRILDFYANQHTAFLHGAGKAGTQHLLHQLALSGKERVLEIGFGTGGSLVNIKSWYPDIQLSGIEQSERMYRKAQKRLRYCFLPSVQLHLIKPEEAYPFPNHHFDVVYIESVLAILPIETILSILQEIKRILKPGGKLGLNETLWLPEVEAAEIERVNAQCLKTFGIIQANAELKDVAGWKALLAKEGFQVNYCAPVEAKAIDSPSTWRSWPSAAYSRIGKLLAGLNGQHRREAQALHDVEKHIFKAGINYLNSYIFVAQS